MRLSRVRQLQTVLGIPHCEMTGGLAGALSVIVTNPLDVLKTRLQLYAGACLQLLNGCVRQVAQTRITLTQAVAALLWLTCCASLYLFLSCDGPDCRMRYLGR